MKFQNCGNSSGRGISCIIGKETNIGHKINKLQIFLINKGNKVVDKKVGLNLGRTAYRSLRRRIKSLL